MLQRQLATLVPIRVYRAVQREAGRQDKTVAELLRDQLGPCLHESDQRWREADPHDHC